jgi:hypothetical protein
MDFYSQVIPAVIVLAANVMSGPHSSLRWETVTAIFGWATVGSIAGYVIALVAAGGTAVPDFFLQTAMFSLLTALSRDYEKVLRPLLPWNR